MKKTLETYEDTKEKALRLLEFRNHSKKELEQKLVQNGASRANIDNVIEFLEKYHLINDEIYAYALANDLFNIKKYGKQRIKSELYKKGINSEISERIISELPQTDYEELSEMIEKRLSDNFEKKNTDRVFRYFVTKGYSFDEIRKCMESIINNHIN